MGGVEMGCAVDTGLVAAGERGLEQLLHEVLAWGLQQRAHEVRGVARGGQPVLTPELGHERLGLGEASDVYVCSPSLSTGASSGHMYIYDFGATKGWAHS